MTGADAALDGLERAVGLPTVVPTIPSVDDLFPLTGDATAPEITAWADRIRTATTRSVEAIVETGRTLRDAKAALPHGAFEEAVRLAGMAPRVAQMFMRIVDNPALANMKHVSYLPPSWGTLYQLSRIEPERLEAAIDAGDVKPDMTRAEVKALAAPRKKPSTVPIYDENDPRTIVAACQGMLGRVFGCMEDLIGAEFDWHLLPSDQYDQLMAEWHARSDRFTSAIEQQSCAAPVEQAPPLDAVARHFFCTECNSFVGQDDAQEEDQYECGNCSGDPFTRGESADGDSNRCPDCNKFGARTDPRLVCPQCATGLETSAEVVSSFVSNIVNIMVNRLPLLPDEEETGQGYQPWRPDMPTFVEMIAVLPSEVRRPLVNRLGTAYDRIGGLLNAVSS